MELATAVDNKNRFAVFRVCVTYNLHRVFQKKCIYTLTADGSTLKIKYIFINCHYSYSECVYTFLRTPYVCIKKQEVPWPMLLSG